MEARGTMWKHEVARGSVCKKVGRKIEREREKQGTEREDASQAVKGRRFYIWKQPLYTNQTPCPVRYFTQQLRMAPLPIGEV